MPENSGPMENRARVAAAASVSSPKGMMTVEERKRLTENKEGKESGGGAGALIRLMRRSRDRGVGSTQSDEGMNGGGGGDQQRLHVRVRRTPAGITVRAATPERVVARVPPSERCPVKGSK